MKEYTTEQIRKWTKERKDYGGWAEYNASKTALVIIDQLQAHVEQLEATLKKQNQDMSVTVWRARDARAANQKHQELYEAATKALNSQIEKAERLGGVNKYLRKQLVKEMGRIAQLQTDKAEQAKEIESFRTQFDC